MGDSAHQQFRIAEIMPQTLCKGRQIRRQPHQSIRLKNRSGRQVQTKNNDRPADENITRSARPIR